MKNLVEIAYATALRLESVPPTYRLSCECDFDMTTKSWLLSIDAMPACYYGEVPVELPKELADQACGVAVERLTDPSRVRESVERCVTWAAEFAREKDALLRDRLIRLARKMMPDQTHSPEPWYLRDDGHGPEPDGRYIEAAGGNTVACGFSDDPRDAERIVACVNFCRGFSTELLLRTNLDDYVGDIIRETKEAMED